MWAEALELLQNAERLQRQFFRVGALHGAPCWEPPVDLYEGENELRLLVALPGVTAQQLEVVLAPGVIVVRGERSLPANSGAPPYIAWKFPMGGSSAASPCPKATSNPSTSAWSTVAWC